MLLAQNAQLYKNNNYQKQMCDSHRQSKGSQPVSLTLTEFS